MPHAIIVDDDPDSRRRSGRSGRKDSRSRRRRRSRRHAIFSGARAGPRARRSHAPRRQRPRADSATRPRPRGTDIVLITGHASVDSAVEALREGRQRLPHQAGRRRAPARRAGQRRAARASSSEEVDSLRGELREPRPLRRRWSARSPAMQEVYDLIARVAPTDATVLHPRRERHRQGARRADASTR